MASEPLDAAHGVEGAADHAGTAFPPFEASTFPSQIFWLTITFAILYVVLSRVILPRLGAIIEERKGRIASDLDEAARMKADADQAMVEMDKQLATARADARAKAEATKAKIDAKIAEASAAKAEELDAKLVEAEGRIDEMKAAAMGNVSSIASSTTAAILSQLGVTASDAEISSAVSKSVDGVAA